MGKLILILGGARSGKSSYAVELAKDFKKSVGFIATCTFQDKEMMERIKKHRRLRPRHWKLIEGRTNITTVLVNLRGKCDVVLVDCLGLWISNLLVENLEDKEIEKKIKGLSNA